MWAKKKPDAPQAADPEPKNLQTNQPPKPFLASWQRATKTTKDQTDATGGRATARLGSNLNVKGEISGNEDLYIEGTVEGLVQLGERKLTVGATARLTADIIAGEVVVYGYVKGNVRAKDRIEIKKDGSVSGDLTTPQIMIEDGAYFKGAIEIDKSAEKEADKNGIYGDGGGRWTEEHLNGQRTEVSDGLHHRRTLHRNQGYRLRRCVPG